MFLLFFVFRIEIIHELILFVCVGGKLIYNDSKGKFIFNEFQRR